MISRGTQKKPKKDDVKPHLTTCRYGTKKTLDDVGDSVKDRLCGWHVLNDSREDREKACRVLS